MEKSDFSTALLMAMSINGMIADPEDKVPWTEPIWKNFFGLVQDYGALIIGRRTYEVMVQEGEIAKLGKIPIAVLSRSAKRPVDNTVFVKTPAEAIKYIQSKDIKRAIIGGGASIALLFLANRLIDDLILDVEPLLMAQGVPLLANMPWTRRAKFVETKSLGGDCIRLHYRFED